MANMNYCRFQNTLSDLSDCYDALEDGLPESEEEQRACRKMLRLCREFVLACEEQEIEEK